LNFIGSQEFIFLVMENYISLYGTQHCVLTLEKRQQLGQLTKNCGRTMLIGEWTQGTGGGLA
jgi:hypothetical protein